MSKEWAFDRFVHGRPRAEGCRVHAPTEEDARRKALALFDYEPGTTFKLRHEEKDKP